MIEKTITYKDLDGNPITRTFYFHLSRSDLADMQLSEKNGMIVKMQAIMDAKDAAGMLKIFRQFIEASVGRKSEDNTYFEKNPELTASFMRSDAFEVLFFEMLANPAELAKFLIGMVPKDVADAAKAETDAAMAKLVIPDKTAEITLPSGDVVEAKAEKVVERQKSLDEYTEKELRDLPDADFKYLLKKYKGNVPHGVMVIAMERFTMIQPKG